MAHKLAPQCIARIESKMSGVSLTIDAGRDHGAFQIQLTHEQFAKLLTESSSWCTIVYDEDVWK